MVVEGDDGAVGAAEEFGRDCPCACAEVEGEAAVGNGGVAEEAGAGRGEPGGLLGEEGGRGLGMFLGMNSQAVMGNVLKHVMGYHLTIMVTAGQNFNFLVQYLVNEPMLVVYSARPTI